jgi:hypothetical protein
MKYLTLFVLAFSILSSPVLYAADPSKEQIAAAAYFDALFGGDANAANALTAAPFFLDRKQTLMKKDEVDAAHQELVGGKGKRPIPKYTITKTDEAPKLDATVFPDHVTFRISIDAGNGSTESIDIFVSVGESPKVLGFSD